MGINIPNFLSSKSKNRKMIDFQDLDHLDGLSMSAVSAKLYKTSSVKNVPCNSFHTGFDFEFISRSCKRNLNIGEMSIKYKPRANSKDKKIKFYNIFNALYEIFKVKIFE